MNKEGYFGNFGGRFVPEALRPPLMELEEAMATIMPSREYRDALQDLLVNYAGRETPLTFCPHLSEKLGLPPVAEAGGPAAHRSAQDQ